MSETGSSDNFNYDFDGISKELGLTVEFLKNLIKDFLIRAGGYTASLYNFTAELNYDMLGKEAHRFNGAALNLRLKRLSSLLTELEANSKEQEKVDYKNLVDKINDEISYLKKNLVKE